MTDPRSSAVSPAVRAALLLEAIRRTRMTRGQVGESKRPLCDHIARTISDRGVPAPLASRIAFQLVLKCEPAHPGSLTTWHPLGDQVHGEVEHLRDLGLVDRRQITVALPKFAATQVDALLEELRDQDATIARTILNVALDAAEPAVAAQRYVREFHRVVGQLKTLGSRREREPAVKSLGMGLGQIRLGTNQHANDPKKHSVNTVNFRAEEHCQPVTTWTFADAGTPGQ